MPSTFMDLTNELLRKFNEVELTEGTFVGARGVQGRAKDAIQNTVNKINQIAWNWPFNATAREEPLVIGQEEYLWPSNMARPDWDSFQIQRNTEQNINSKTLAFQDRDKYYEYYKDLDDDRQPLGRGIPDFVYPSHGNGYGLTPSPDRPYTIRYRFWQTPPKLVQPLDQVTIPDQFDYVIISGAAVDMHNFYDNAEAASIMRSEFSTNLSYMRGILLNNYHTLRDHRVNFGGNNRRSIFF